MPTLVEKINQLKCDVVTAARLVEFWDKQVKTHGAHRAEEFYLHLGLNHIERKSHEFDGLTLRREPRETEKIAVKGIAKAQESAKEKIRKVLLALRSQLIEDGLKGIKKLDPAKYHTLVLKVPPESRQDLRDRLVSTYRQGRKLVAIELGKEGKQHEDEENEEDEFEDLDTLTDVGDTSVVNDTQSRIIGSAARFVLLGLTGAALIDAVRGQIVGGSVSYIDRTSTGLANRVISIGRGVEAQNRRDEWGRVEYSALLDQNVCGPCAAEDGQEAAREEDLIPVPNPECEGGDWCRCFHVFVQD